MESGYIQACKKGSRQSEHQKSDIKFKEYSILCMGRCKPLGSLNLFLLYARQLSGAKSYLFVHLQFSSVQSLSCVQFCDPMDCSKPGIPVHHQLPEFLFFCLLLASPGLSYGTQDLHCHMQALSGDVQDLAPRAGIEPRPPALGAWGLSHWTTREVPSAGS